MTESDPQRQTRATELRAIRKMLGLTQVEFAAELGMQSNTLSRLERGAFAIREPILRLARRIYNDSDMGGEG